jgi:hypothetical protein
MGPGRFFQGGASPQRLILPAPVVSAGAALAKSDILLDGLDKLSAVRAIATLEA